MQISNELLDKLQRLSAISLESDKYELAKEQLSEIVQFVENINTLDLDAMDNHFLAIEQSQFMREDTPHLNEEIPREVLETAPSVENNFFIVPKIIE